MNNNILFWSSNHITKIKNTLSGYIFTEDSLILGQKGLDKYLLSHDAKTLFDEFSRNGKYVLTLLNSKNNIIITSDFFGLENLYYYDDGKNWAVSTSFLFLARKVKEFGWKNRIYQPALATYSMSVDGFFFGQLMSNKTIFEDIKLLNRNTYICIDETGFQIKSLFKVISEQSTYQQLIEKFVNVSVARMNSLLKLSPTCNFVDLSGGQDSRVIFGLCTRSNNLKKQVFVRSDKNKKDEYEIAQSISNFYSFSMSNASYAAKQLDGRESFELWSLANAGIYRPIYKPVTKSPRKLVQFNGANFIDSTYVSKTAHQKIADWKPHIDAKMYDLVAGEFLDSFKEFGVTAEDKNAMALHYMQRRARIHYGRAWYSHLSWFNWSPLMCSEFLEVVDIGAYLGFGKDKVMCDIMTGIDSKLPEFKFSNPKSQFSSEDILLSKILINQVKVSDRDDLKVYGEMSDYNDTHEVENPLDFYHVMKDSLVKNKESLLEVSPYVNAKEIATMIDHLKQGKDIKDKLTLSSMVGIGLLSDLVC